MNLSLAFDILVILGITLALAWSYSAHKLAEKGYKGRYEDPPTEEIPCPATMKIGPRLEEFGPGKPLPPTAAVTTVVPPEYWDRM